MSKANTPKWVKWVLLFECLVCTFMGFALALPYMGASPWAGRVFIGGFFFACGIWMWGWFLHECTDGKPQT